MVKASVKDLKKLDMAPYFGMGGLCFRAKERRPKTEAG